MQRGDKLKSFKTEVVIPLLILGLIAIWNMDRLAATFFEAEHATVRLKNCASAECELHGTLRIEPMSGDYLLTSVEGRVTRFPQSSLASARWPAKIAK
ncbi:MULTISPECIES: hypothetical protein [Pseudomonas]|uniref:Uncharacterized protein n=4 Tax=Gammaproteobacteria TaxID=1236 RepID=A0A1V0M5E4_PSEAI|nr:MULTISPECIES: hypothetical protein [Pseudomonas]MCP8472897.1 hypothetical protein [Pseudomonas triclosanedens]MCP8479467.1 hypothetical protein [Pseudomonas triclosanedens]WQN29965.1 hypothetical protein ULE26_23215 [Stutzerimonas stutzeri]AGL46541.1 hypothetical protein pOZ176_589 [Pseudomonas aeruginosa PA96]ANI18743.1 hypothetical protein A9C11_32305 [Pseudomonas citronellolis]